MRILVSPIENTVPIALYTSHVAVGVEVFPSIYALFNAELDGEVRFSWKSKIGIDTHTVVLGFPNKSSQPTP